MSQKKFVRLLQLEKKLKGKWNYAAASPQDPSLPAQFLKSWIFATSGHNS